MQTTLNKPLHTILGQPLKIGVSFEFYAEYSGTQGNAYKRIAMYVLENHPYETVIFDYLNGETVVSVTGKALMAGHPDLSGEKIIRTMRSLPIIPFHCKVEKGIGGYVATFFIPSKY